MVDTTPYLNVTGTQSFSFQPNIISDLPTGVNINVEFTNGDPTGTTHTFTIIGCANISIPAGASLSDYLGGSKCSKTPLVNIVPPAPPETSPGNFTAPPKAGWYEFVCTSPGHFQQGMYGYIAFGMAVPANLSVASSSPGPGLAVFIIIGTIVTLTVIAIVLGFVVGRREGARHEMPPERLGYPEPAAPERSPPSPPPPHA